MIKFPNAVIRYLAMAVALACLFSCAKIEAMKDRAAIKDTVTSYNKGVIVAAKTGDVQPMKGIASKEVLRKLYWWCAAYEDTHAYMDATLLDIRFTNIAIAGQNAKAFTAEDWVYVYRDITTKKIVLPETGSHYEMEYLLEKKDGKWIITAIKIKLEKTKDAE